MDFRLFFLAFFYETAGTLPYRALAYYPFRKQLRFPWQTVALAIGLSQFVQSFLFACLTAAGRPTRWVEAAAGLVCLVIFLLCVKADRWKVLFFYIFIMDYIAVVRGIAWFTKSRFFSGTFSAFPAIDGAWLSLALFCVTVPFMFQFLRRTKDRVFQTEAPFFWRTIWLLPAFTTGIVLMFTWDLSPSRVTQVRFLAARTFLLLAMFLVYSVLLHALDEIRKMAAIRERETKQEELLALMRIQYQQLSEHMEETRRARHDLKQHLQVLDRLMKAGNLADMTRYLENYKKSLPQETFHNWCKNYAVNALIGHYADRAKAAGVQFEARLSFPEQLPVNEAEFCALLGNLLDNALDACLACLQDAPFIRIAGKEENKRIVLAVDNTSAQPPRWKDGRLLSTKHEGYGTGTASAETIAGRYQGTASFRWENGVFYGEVLMYGDTFL